MSLKYKYKSMKINGIDPDATSGDIEIIKAVWKKEGVFSLDFYMWIETEKGFLNIEFINYVMDKKSQAQTKKELDDLYMKTERQYSKKDKTFLDNLAGKRWTVT